MFGPLTSWSCSSFSCTQCRRWRRTACTGCPQRCNKLPGSSSFLRGRSLSRARSTFFPGMELPRISYQFWPCTFLAGVHPWFYPRASWSLEDQQFSSKRWSVLINENIRETKEKYLPFCISYHWISLYDLNCSGKVLSSKFLNLYWMSDDQAMFDWSIWISWVPRYSA